MCVCVCVCVCAFLSQNSFFSKHRFFETLHK